MANYRIVSDTACDLSQDIAQDMGLAYVPFKINIEGREYVDNEDLDIEVFIERMKESKNPIRTACPAPAEFEKALEDQGDCPGIFLVTISSKLSGSYNAAALGMEEFKKSHPDTPVALIDSKSASAGQTNVVYELYKLIQAGLAFDQIQEKIEDFINSQETLFLLESLDNLIKNGRIKKTAGLVINKLNVKPIMRSNEGEIALHEVHRGFKRSLRKLADYVISSLDEEDNQRFTISHVDGWDKAGQLKDWILEKRPKLDIKISQAKGLSTGYADVGGLVIGFLPR
ncbi:MAG: DegV family protein [Tissierellia bacterium]|nr:DegV family protein [Tissierellia bacterium]